MSNENGTKTPSRLTCIRVTVKWAVSTQPREKVFVLTEDGISLPVLFAGIRADQRTEVVIRYLLFVPNGLQMNKVSTRLIS